MADRDDRERGYGYDTRRSSTERDQAHRGDRERGYGYDTGRGSERDTAKERPPEQAATDRVFRVRQETESIAIAVAKLSTIVQRNEWHDERGRLTKKHAVLVEQLKQREIDAKASAQAQGYYDATTRDLGTVAKQLKEAKEPRPVPPVSGEEAVEPSIENRTAVPDDVIAWVGGLSAGERSAIAARVKRVQESADRTDGFAVALANYIGEKRISKAFHNVAKDPRAHFGRAAYERLRTGATAANAGSGDRGAKIVDASATAPAVVPQSMEQSFGTGINLPPNTAAPASFVQLDLHAAMSMAPEVRKTEQEARRRAVADASKPAGERKRLDDERAMLEFAAHEQDEQAPAMPDPGPHAVDFGAAQWGARTASADTNWVVSTDPVFLRAMVEREYTKGGETAVLELIGHMQNKANLARNNQTSPAEGERLWRLGWEIASAMGQQYALLKQENALFLADYERTAHHVVDFTLTQSEQRTLAELAKYGITRDEVTDLVETSDRGWKRKQRTMYGGGDTAGSKELATAAGELVASQPEIDNMRARVAKAQLDLFEAKSPDVLSPGHSKHPEQIAPLKALIAALGRKAAAAEQAHLAAAQAREDKFPILASYRKVEDHKVTFDVAKLEKLGGTGSRRDEIAPHLFGILDNIKQTREGLKPGGELSIWKEERVRQLTMPQMLIVPGSVRERAVREKTAQEKRGGWGGWAIAALTAGLALLAAIPTGGSSLAVGVVAMAEIAGATLDVYLLIDHLEEFNLQKAAAGTDMDKARAISADDPSLFWLALDVILTGVSLGVAARSLKHLRGARDAAKAAKTTAALDDALAAIHAEHQAGHVSADAAMKLEDEVMAAHGVARGEGAAATAATKASTAADAAEDVVEVTRRPAAVDSRVRIKPADFASVEAKLGVPVATDRSLKDGVRVKLGKAKNGDVIVERILVGSETLLDDVLHHRATIARITRYNGWVGKLRGVWDDLVIALGGRIDHNPFPRHSKAWASFEELRKLDELIELRYLRWAEHASPEILDDEIQFLRGEVAHHQSIVTAAKETGELGGDARWIERADTGQVTQEAVAQGYPLPAENPDWYYYRRSTTKRGTFDLITKPTAPEAAQPWRVEIVDGKKMLVDGDIRKVGEIITASWHPDEVVRHMRSRPGLGTYLEMLEREGLAATDDLDKQIVALWQKLGAIEDAKLGHEVKQVYRQHVVARLTDKNLDDAASYERMRAMLDRLESSDRGNLAELWYQARYASKSEHHVAATVTRSVNGEAVQEGRVIDLFDGETATEVKNITGPLGTEQIEQFEAYIMMVADKIKAPFQGEMREVKKVKYVFAHADGARANARFIRRALARYREFLSFDLFGLAGTRVLVKTEDDLNAFLKKLERRS